MHQSNQTTTIITERILEVLSDEWQTLKPLVFKLKIKDMIDARVLQIMLIQLEIKEKKLTNIKMGKKSWKLNELLNITSENKKLIKKSADFKSNDKKSCFNEGQAHYDKQENGKSIEYYKNAIKIDPKDCVVWYNLRLSHDGLDNNFYIKKRYDKVNIEFDKAIECYEKKFNLLHTSESEINKINNILMEGEGPTVED